MIIQTLKLLVVEVPHLFEFFIISDHRFQATLTPEEGFEEEPSKHEPIGCLVDRLFVDIPLFYGKPIQRLLHFVKILG